MGNSMLSYSSSQPYQTGVRQLVLQTKSGFDQALEQAHRSFVCIYPEWGERLFDRDYFHHEALPLLTRCATGGVLPGARALAQTWAGTALPEDETHSQLVRDLTPVAQCFLDSLRGAFKVV